MAILECKNVKYTYRTKYQTVPVLKGINASFEKGKLYAIIGKSGSGKSTLLSLLAGLMLPEEGEVLCDGVSTAQMDLDEYRRCKVAVVYQSFRLFPLLTSVENIAFPMELRGYNEKDAREKAKVLLSKVSLPETVQNSFPEMLSGGEQQRVAVARAMGMESGLILADEPTGNLDTENSASIILLLSQLAHEENYCVIVVTHDLEIAAKADVVYRMRDGLLNVE